MSSDDLLAPRSGKSARRTPAVFLIVFAVLCFPAARWVEQLAQSAGSAGSEASQPVAEEAGQPVAAAGQSSLNPAAAAAIAVNRLSVTAGGYQLSHPLHSAQFTASGVQFSPRGSEQVWSWSAEAIGSYAPGVATPAGAKLNEPAIDYHRGDVTERYRLRTDCIEQEFVLHRPPPADRDFVVTGSIAAEGRFESHPRGWLWRHPGGSVVSLGGVSVFDSEGKKLEARMEVAADRSTITVAAAGLAAASYPVTIDPEIGTNDFRISRRGDDFATTFKAVEPAAAYNSAQDEYLVVWKADGTSGHQNIDEYEIHGQRISASNGALLSTQFQISTDGADGEVDTLERPDSPAIAYNSGNDEYLVVWTSTESRIRAQRLRGSDAALIGAEIAVSSAFGGEPAVAYSALQGRFLVTYRAGEIQGQFIDRNGNTVGAEFAVSEMESSPDDNSAARNPSVSWSSRADCFLVVWYGYYATSPTENEIYGQMIDARTGLETGVDDFRVSTMGTDGDPSIDAFDPDVGYDSTNNRFLVVWEANPGTPPDNAKVPEVFGRFLDGTSGSLLGAEHLLLSQLGSTTSSDRAESPVVSYILDSDRFIVAWNARENLGAGFESEMLMRLLDGDKMVVEGEVKRISDMGPPGAGFDELRFEQPGIAASDDEALVCWPSDDDNFGLVENEVEIFGQRIGASRFGDLIEVGTNDFRISEAGADGDKNEDMFVPAVAYNPADGYFLVAWESTRWLSVIDPIFCNRIDATTGARLDPDDRAVSTGGGSGTLSNQLRANRTPAIAYNTVDNEFLVVWEGSRRAPEPLSREIYGRRIAGGSGDFVGGEMAISDGGLPTSAENPALAFNPLNNQYLVVWQAEQAGALASEEFEIFGQRLSSAGAQIGTDDFRISTTGSDGDAARDATNPAVAFAGENYDVVWQADGGAVNDKTEIYLQKIAAGTGALVGANTQLTTTPGGPLLGSENPDICYLPAVDFSMMVCQIDAFVDGEYQILAAYTIFPPGTLISNTPGHTAINPAAAYNPVLDEVVVVWESIPMGDTDGSEIAMLRIDGRGVPFGPDDPHISDMGPAGDPAFNAHTPAVGINLTNGTFLTVWSGDDHENGRIDDEFEIFGQFFQGSPFRITEISLSGDDVVIRFQSEANVRYRLRESTDLSDWDVADVPVLLGTGGIDQFTDVGGAVAVGQKYYRITR